jgi:hypothetical protein
MTHPYVLMLCLFQVKENGVLQVSLERRKEELHERRLALEKEVRTSGRISYTVSVEAGHFYYWVTLS